MLGQSSGALIGSSFRLSLVGLPTVEPRRRATAPGTPEGAHGRLIASRNIPFGTAGSAPPPISVKLPCLSTLEEVTGEDSPGGELHARA